MAIASQLFALRDDVQDGTTATALRELLGARERASDRARPAACRAAVRRRCPTPLSDAAYRDFILRWRVAIGRG